MAQTAPINDDQTFYQILELQPTATLQEIKKSYRKLALQHHPDRNPPHLKEQATIRFRQVNEAYEVLSDPDQKRQYDAELRSGGSGFGGARPTQQHHGGGGPFYHNPGHHHYYNRRGRRPRRDAFSQFNDLFQNDPFFNEAFKDMDDLFAKTFQPQHGGSGGAAFVGRTTATAAAAQPKRSWGRWIADCLGIDFQITTSTTTIGADGRPQTSRTHTSYGGASSRNINSNNARSPQRRRNTYTSKSTRTIIENGQRVTIQSLEKDGNKIEEKYVNNELVQRLINGVPEQQYRLNGPPGGADL